MKRPAFLTVVSLSTLTLLPLGCGGDDVAGGEDGHDSLIRITPEAPGAQCAAGGQRVDVGVDEGGAEATADDGVLDDDEIRDTNYICQPEAETPEEAFNSLVRVTEVAPDPGANDGVDGCVLGGQLVEVGLDDGRDASGASTGTAGDGVLADGEVDSSTYVCGADVNTSYRVSGTLVPGDSLALEVPSDADDLVFEAQVNDDGVVRSYDRWHEFHDGAIEEITFMEHAGTGHYRTFAVNVARLSDESFIAVAYVREFDQGGTDLGPRILKQRLDASGKPTEAPSVVNANPTNASYVSDYGATALPNGAYLVAYGDRVNYHVFDGSDQETATGQMFTGTDFSTGVRAVHLAPTSGGVVASYALNTSARPGYYQRFDAGLVKQGPAVQFEANRVDYHSAVAELGNGSLALAWPWNGGDYADPSGGTAAVYDTNDTLVAEVEISNVEAATPTIAVGPDDDWLVNFAPDWNYAAFAILDDAGAIVAPKRSWSSSYPDNLASGTWGDGSYMVAMLRDDDAGLALRTIGADGALASPTTSVDASSRLENDGIEFFPLNDHEGLFFGAPSERDDAPVALRAARGYLDLERTSATEAILHNYSAQTLDVVISAR